MPHLCNERHLSIKEHRHLPVKLTRTITASSAQLCHLTRYLFYDPQTILWLDNVTDVHMTVPMLG